MTAQTTLWGDEPLPAHNGTETSVSAAESVRDDCSRLRALVLDAIRRSVFGLTCDEVEIATRLSHQTASARVNELMRAGRIRPVAKRATRSGRMAQVWIVRGDAR